MVIFRALGWILIFAALVTATHDIFYSVTGDHGFKIESLGEVWTGFSPTQPDAFQASMLNKFGHLAWAPIGFFLSIWAFAVFLVPGLIFEWIGRPYSTSRYQKTGRAKKAPPPVRRRRRRPPPPIASQPDL